jgi:hypothetical protein
MCASWQASGGTCESCLFLSIQKLNLCLRQLALGKKYSEEAFFQRPIVVLSENEKYLIDEVRNIVRLI